MNDSYREFIIRTSDMMNKRDEAKRARAEEQRLEAARRIEKETIERRESAKQFADSQNRSDELRRAWARAQAEKQRLEAARRIEKETIERREFLMRWSDAMNKSDEAERARRAREKERALESVRQIELKKRHG